VGAIAGITDHPSKIEDPKGNLPADQMAEHNHQAIIMAHAHRIVMAHAHPIIMARAHRWVEPQFSLLRKKF
jgi:hypothetical protein